MLKFKDTTTINYTFIDNKLCVYVSVMRENNQARNKHAIGYVCFTYMHVVNLFGGNPPYQIILLISSLSRNVILKVYSIAPMSNSL